MTELSPRRGMVSFLCCAVLLLSCQPELHVAFASGQERAPSPRFVVTDPEWPDARPRYNTIQVLQEDGGVIWWARAEPFGDQSSVAQFTFGEPPAGFVSLEGPRALEAEHTYSVFVVGAKRGSLKFKMRPDGMLQVVKE